MWVITALIRKLGILHRGVLGTERVLKLPLEGLRLSISQFEVKRFIGIITSGNTVYLIALLAL